MKIAILAPSHKSFITDFLPNINYNVLPDGYAGATFIGTIIKELLLRGHEIIAVTTTPATLGNYDIQHYRNGRFSWYVVPSRPYSLRFNGRKPGRIVDLFSYEIRCMKGIIENTKPDFIHSFWSYEFTAVAKESNIPFLATVEDNAFVILKYFKNIYRFGRMVMAERNLKDIKFLSTVSPYMVKYCERKGARVKVIPNPTPVPCSLEEVEHFVQERLIKFPSFKIVMINNGWEARKNGKCGLLAFKLLLSKYPESTLHLFGSGSEEGGPANVDATSIGVKNTYFHGMVNRDIILSNLKDAHLFLHPALEESFGVVLIEAMAMGVPTVGGDNSGGVPWVINDNDLLVDVSNFEKVGEKIIQILSDKHFYAEKSLSCYKRTKEQFSSEIVVDKFEEYYKLILSEWKLN